MGDLRFKINANGESITRCPYGKKAAVGGRDCMSCLEFRGRRLGDMSVYCSLEGDPDSKKKITKPSKGENNFILLNPKITSECFPSLVDIIKSSIVLYESQNIYTLEEIDEGFVEKVLELYKNTKK